MTSGSFSAATAMAVEPGEDIGSHGDLFSMKLASLVQGRLHRWLLHGKFAVFRFLPLHAFLLELDRQVSVAPPGLSQQTEAAMENLLPAVSEIGLTSLEISEDLNRTKEFEQERRSTLDGAREKIQRAACRVMDILSTSHYATNVSGDPASGEKENSDP